MKFESKYGPGDFLKIRYEIEGAESPFIYAVVDKVIFTKDQVLYSVVEDYSDWMDETNVVCRMIEETP